MSLNDHERRRRLARAEAVAKQTREQLTAIREALAVAAYGPPAASYDSGRGTGTRTIDGHPVPVSSTELQAIWNTDEATAQAAELDRAIAALVAAADRVAEVGTWALRVASTWEREKVGTAGEPGCQRCSRLGYWVPPFTENPTDVKGNLPAPLLLCEWEWRYVRKTGKLPTETDLRAHLEGRKVTVPA